MRSAISKFGHNLRRQPPFYILLAALFAAYILSFHRHIVVYVILLLVSALIHYSHYRGFPTINLGHVFFIAFIIDWHDGLAGEMLFILLAGLLPEIMAGYFEFKTLLAYPIMVGVISLPILIFHSDFVLLGILSSLLYYSIMFYIGGLTKEPLHERLLESVVPLILNIFYFLYIAEPLYRLLDFII